MSGTESEQARDELVTLAAANLGKAVLGRDLTAEETESLNTIFKSTVQALRHGFIRRLAEHVAAEREDERVEEFFEDVIQPD